MNKPLKISIIGVKGYPFVYGGYETLVKELVERLVHKNVQITIYCHRSLFKHKPKYHQGIKLVYIPSIELKAFTQLIHSFLSTLHACLHKNDLLFYVNAANGPLGIITKILGKKTIINVDGMEWLRPKWKGIGAKYYKFAASMATRFFDIIVTDAYEMQRTYLELFNKESIMIAYGADKFKLASIDLIQKWGLEKNEYYLIVGRLIPDNNAQILIDAFLSFQSSKKLVIVGDNIFNDPYANKIKTFKKNSNIIFTGYIKEEAELSALYQNSFIYLHGHEYGGTNPTLIKAMAEGTCILALNTRFNREVLQDGKMGIFFDKNTDNLAAIMIDAEVQDKLDNNWVKSFQKNSQKGLINIYQWDYIAEQYYKTFISLKYERNF